MTKADTSTTIHCNTHTTLIINILNNKQMKRNLLLLTLAAGVVMSSCGKMETGSSLEREGEVLVNFSLGYATKATGGIDDDAVNTAYVFAFDGNRLDGSAYVTSTTGTIKVTKGLRRFIAVVNPNEEFTYGAATSPAALLSMVSQLSSEALTDMVMVGENNQTITDATTTVLIDVTRLVSRVSVNSLKFQFSGALAGKSVSEVAMYVKNFPTSQTYEGTPGTLYSSGLFTSKQNTFEVYDLIGTIGDGQTDTTPHHFFCYQRPTEVLTSGSGAIRLCVTGKIDGQRYYWSIPVNNGSVWTDDAFVDGDEHFGVKRNHSYEYEIIITRAGIPDDGNHPDPNDPTDIGDDNLEDDQDLEVSDINFILRVVDWVEVEEQTVTF